MCRCWRCRFTDIHHTTYHFGVSCWRFTNIRQHKIPPTRHTIVMSCWRYSDIHQHKIPPTRHTILVCRVRGLPTYANIIYLQHDIPLLCHVGDLPTYANTKYLQHDIPLLCHVGGLPTYTTQNTSNTTYHWGVVYVVTFRPSYYVSLWSGTTTGEISVMCKNTVHICLNIHIGIERPHIVFNIIYFHGVDWVMPVMKDCGNLFNQF